MNYQVNDVNYASETEILSPKYPYISALGVKMPFFQSSFYTAYYIALLMPILGFVLYFVSNFWMFFDCLLVDFVSLMCWAFVRYYGYFSINDNSCYVEKWIKNNIELVALIEIKGHRIRCIFAIIISILNIFPILAMSQGFIRLFEPFFYRRAYEGGITVTFMTFFIITFWVQIAIQEIRLAKRI